MPSSCLHTLIHSAGFYAENILLYSEEIRTERRLPLPIGTSHKFAPIALGDVAQVAAHVLSGEGEHGFSDKHRGQLIVLTGTSFEYSVSTQTHHDLFGIGPMLVAGNELATAASSALGVEIEFENISQ